MHIIISREKLTDILSKYYLEGQRIKSIDTIQFTAKGKMGQITLNSNDILKLYVEVENKEVEENEIQK